MYVLNPHKMTEFTESPKKIANWLNVLINPENILPITGKQEEIVRYRMVPPKIDSEWAAVDDHLFSCSTAELALVPGEGSIKFEGLRVVAFALLPSDNIPTGQTSDTCRRDLRTGSSVPAVVGVVFIFFEFRIFKGFLQQFLVPSMKFFSFSHYLPKFCIRNYFFYPICLFFLHGISRPLYKNAIVSKFTIFCVNLVSVPVVARRRGRLLLGMAERSGRSKRLSFHDSMYTLNLLGIHFGLTSLNSSKKKTNENGRTTILF
jgi:hypothetical protein